MDYQELNYGSLTREQELEASQAFPALMRKTYLWMTFALIITGLTAYTVATNETITYLLFQNPTIIWVLFGAELLLVIGLSAAIQKISLSVATLMFVVYAAINGLTLSSIFWVYSIGSIATTFFVTAATFGAMSVYGYFTNTDLTKMGRLLIMALIGLIIATIVNLFLHNTMLDMIVSYAGVLIFVGLTAYDTQKIKQMFLMAPDASEATQKYAVLGALTLYLDFINLFIYLLRIFGKRD
jgi:hypothetical protein